MLHTYCNVVSIKEHEFKLNTEKVDVFMVHDTGFSLSGVKRKDYDDKVDNHPTKTHKITLVEYTWMIQFILNGELNVDSLGNFVGMYYVSGIDRINYIGDLKTQFNVVWHRWWFNYFTDNNLTILKEIGTHYVVEIDGKRHVQQFERLARSFGQFTFDFLSNVPINVKYWADLPRSFWIDLFRIICCIDRDPRKEGEHGQCSLLFCLFERFSYYMHNVDLFKSNEYVEWDVYFIGYKLFSALNTNLDGIIGFWKKQINLIPQLSPAVAMAFQK